jgi:hypothetical protein
MIKPENIKNPQRSIMIWRLVELFVILILIAGTVILFSIVQKSRDELRMNLNNPTANSQRAILERDLVTNQKTLSKVDKLAPVPDDVAVFVTQLQLLGAQRNSTVNVADIQEEKTNTNGATSPTPRPSPDFPIVPILLHVTAVGAPNDLLALLHDFEYMPYLVEAPNWTLQVMQPGSLGQSQGPAVGEGDATAPACAPGSLTVQLRLFTQEQVKKI